MKTKEWIKRQEEVYAGKGFGETERSIRVAEKRFGVVMPFLGIPPKYVLDIGCNDGFFTQYLQDKGYNTIGIDLPAVIKKAKKLHPQCNLIGVNLDTEDMPLKTYKDYFEVIIALEIIEHLYYDVQLLCAAAFYLKKGGVVIVTTPSSDAKLVDDHIRFYPLESLRKLLVYSGLEVIGLETMGEYNVAVGKKT